MLKSRRVEIRACQGDLRGYRAWRVQSEGTLCAGGTPKGDLHLTSTSATGARRWHRRGAAPPCRSPVVAQDRVVDCQAGSFGQLTDELQVAVAQLGAGSRTAANPT